MEQNAKKILIVDDQEGLRESMAGILAIEGYDISAVEDGFKAVELVRTVVPDVAFIDVRMPGMNGVEAFRALRKICPGIIVFLMTAYAEEGLVQQALDEGAYGCIHKPFEMERVLELLKKIFEENDADTDRARSGGGNK
jgi:DNA-binding NtrC family response regulator